MFAMSCPAVPSRPYILHPNEIQAMYMQMFNNGQHYIGQLGSHPVSIDEWRDRELEKHVR